QSSQTDAVKLLILRESPQPLSVVRVNEKAVGCNAQAGMMMEAAPVAALEVAKTKLLFELLVIALDPPARLGHLHKTLERRAPGQVGEPVFRGFALSFGPLDQQPFFRPGLRALGIAMRRTHPHGR